MTRKLVFVGLILTLLALPLSACAQAPEEELTAEEFFQKNVINAIVFGGAGGSSDYAARTFGAYWADAAGTDLRVVPRHGRGGRVGVLNDIFTAEPDGLTLGGAIGWGWGIYGPKVVEQLPEAKYVIEEYNWIGGLQREGIIFVVPPDSEVETMADLIGKEDLLFAGGAPAFGGTLAGAAFIDWFGVDAKIVPGIDIPDKRLGLQRGEFDFSCETSGNAKLWEEEGQVKLIASVSSERLPDAPEVPAITEQLDLSQDQLAVLSSIIAASTSMRVWFAPPGVPEDRVKWLRTAWSGVVQREPFQKMWQRRWDEWTEPIHGEEMQTWVKERMAQPPGLLQELLEIEKKYIGN